MPRKLLIFGNGLGRALDNDAFQLSKAYEFAWKQDNRLTEDQRALIRRCLPSKDVVDDSENPWPDNEHELDALHRVVAACDEIVPFEDGAGDSWLTEEGKKFPQAIRSFIHRTASYFHRYRKKLPDAFVQPLRKHITENKSHVATLNYDGLLYKSFANTGVFKGYDCLIDGFSHGSFSEEKLNRYNPKSTSFYLHLHGSPLYIDDEHGATKKVLAQNLGDYVGSASTHLVLTNIRHKPSVIAASPLLSAYWHCLETEAIPEVEEIVVFGYGGADGHLNRLIRGRKAGVKVKVVCRKSEDAAVDSVKIWERRFGGKVTVEPYPDILEFTNW